MKKKSLIILSIIVLIFVCITLYLTREHIMVFYKLITNGEVVKSYLERFGHWAAVIFFVFQILQVVIFFIPERLYKLLGIYIWCLRRNFTFLFRHSSWICNIILHMSKVWKEASTKICT